MLILSAVAAMVSIRKVGQSFIPAVDPTETRKAFYNARWGMTPGEVEKANGSSLEPLADNSKFYNDAQADPSRVRSYQKKGGLFLGREATITYTFRDDRLFA